MSQNLSKDTQEEKLLRKIEDLERQLKEMRSNQLRTFIVPVVSADPATTVNGQCWYNSTSHELKVKKNGTVRTVTTS